MGIGLKKKKKMLVFSFPTVFQKCLLKRTLKWTKATYKAVTAPALLTDRQ